VGDVLADAFTVYLRGTVETLAARVGEGQGRPWLEGDKVAAMQRLLAPRAALYEELADLVVDVDDATPEQIAQQIAHAARESTTASG
jgi:shikimate kinase